MTSQADLEAVETSRAALKVQLEAFKEKQREFVKKGEKVKKELDELKAAHSMARVPQEMNDAMLAKAIRETEEAKEKEFAIRIAKFEEDRIERQEMEEMARRLSTGVAEVTLQTFMEMPFSQELRSLKNEVDEKVYQRKLQEKAVELEGKNIELANKETELMAAKSRLEAKEGESKIRDGAVALLQVEMRDYACKLDAANEKYTRLQNTVQDYFKQERVLEDRRENLKKMLE